MRYTNGKRSVPRKIIFCIDLDEEMNQLIGPSLDGGVYHCLLQTNSRLKTALFLILRYVRMNRIINPEDEYAIISMKNYATWQSDFTRDLVAIQSAVNNLGENRQTYLAFDMDSLFKVIDQHVNLQDTHQFIQAIVIYGRSNILPSQLSAQLYRDVRAASNFTMDVIYARGPLHKYPKCQSIYTVWVEVDSDSVPGWYYDIARMGRSSFTKAMAQLVAHPLQRGSQEEIKKEWRVENPTPVDDSDTSMKDEGMISLSDSP